MGQFRHWCYYVTDFLLTKLTNLQWSQQVAGMRQGTVHRKWSEMYGSTVFYPLQEGKKMIFLKLYVESQQKIVRGKGFHIFFLWFIFSFRL